jgi:hypothetical protein
MRLTSRGHWRSAPSLPSGKLEGQSAPRQQTENTSCNRLVMYDGPHGQRQWPNGVAASVVLSQRPPGPPQALPSGQTCGGSVGAGSQNTAGHTCVVSGSAARVAGVRERGAGSRPFQAVQAARERSRERTSFGQLTVQAGWPRAKGEQRTRLPVSARQEAERSDDPRREAAHCDVRLCQFRAVPAPLDPATRITVQSPTSYSGRPPL